MYDFDIEKNLLGGLLNDNSRYDEINSLINESDFSKTLYKNIFSEIKSGVLKGEDVNIQTLCHNPELKKHTSEILSLTTNAPSSNVAFFAKKLKDITRRRTLLKLGEKMTAAAKSETSDIKETIEAVEMQLSSLSVNKSNSSIISFYDALKQAIDKIQEDMKTGGIPGLKTNYSGIDICLGGLQKQEFIILGARPSMGKTSLAVNIIQNIIDRKIPVAFFTIEMPAFSIATRMICDVSNISSTKIREGKLTYNDFEKLHDAVTDMHQEPLYFCDYQELELLDLKTKARQLKRQHNIQALFIDYIGKIKLSGNLQHWERFSIISSELKALARELDIPVFALQQLTRSAEGKAPNMAELRDSGSLEQDADVIMFLHRDNKEDSKTTLSIVKNRNGQTAELELNFLAEKTRFVYLGFKGNKESTE